MSDFPKWMHHPHERPAILSDDYAIGARPPVGYSAPPGRPRQFPPVQVMDEAQEAYYAAQGYRVGNSQKAAFVPRPVMPLVNQRAAAQPEPFDPEWPQWVSYGAHRAVAKTPADAEAMIAGWKAVDGVAAKPSAKPEPHRAKAGRRSGSGFAVRGALMSEAKALGLKPNPKWKLADVRQAIEEARHEGQGKAA